jgi:transcription termination factor Rho
MFGQMITPAPQGAGMDITNATEAIIQSLAQSKNNAEFLESIGKNGL